MHKLNSKGDMAAGNEHLCTRCSWGQCMTGYRESDRLAICTNNGLNMVVPFTMLNCTSFHDKHRPNWSQMQRLAINLRPTRVSKPTTGFGAVAEACPATTPQEHDKSDGQDEAVDQAAFVRWIIDHIAEKEPAGDDRGYIW